MTLQPWKANDSTLVVLMQLRCLIHFHDVLAASEATSQLRHKQFKKSRWVVNVNWPCRGIFDRTKVWPPCTVVLVMTEKENMWGLLRFSVPKGEPWTTWLLPLKNLPSAHCEPISWLISPVWGSTTGQFSPSRKDLDLWLRGTLTKGSLPAHGVSI